MVGIVWPTDPHLNFLLHAGRESFFTSLPNGDAIGITGNIEEAHDGRTTFGHSRIGGPEYFVLGNHDFLPGSTAGVR